MTNKNIGLMAYLEESRFYHILITDYWLCQDKSVFFSIFTPQFIQYITFKTNKQTLKRNVPKKENPQYHVMWKYLKHTMQFSIWQDSSKTKIALKSLRKKNILLDYKNSNVPSVTALQSSNANIFTTKVPICLVINHMCIWK